ncbi:PAS domain-containing protein [Streptomyces tuirus]|uniref:PAS domain-containing protein n=1 Tax=Streptomyces tuirus TaxID=68278 RepID=A0A941J1N0_9ACTN|nr:PAS domain-containing protein [Streptomyces tuirus]
MVTDSAGRVTHFSAGAPALWGYDSEEILGKGLADLVSPDRTALRGRDGRTLQARAGVFPLGSEESPEGFVLVARRQGEARRLPTGRRWS